MGILLCEQNFRDVWRRNKSVGPTGRNLSNFEDTHTHAAKLVVEMNGLCLMTVMRSAKARLPMFWDHGVPTNMASSWGGKPHTLFLQSQRNWRKVLNKIRQTENRFACCYGKIGDRPTVLE